MSRNLQRKKTKPAAARKTTPASRRSSPTSSDDDYAGLDEISDSDDEEPDVEAAEERAIIDSLANGSEYDEDADDESNDDDAPQPELDDDDSVVFEGFPDDAPVAQTSDFFTEQLPPTPHRRVHFDVDEVDYSSNSDSDEYDSLGSTFPDLMAEEDLDPRFRQQIQNDDGADDDDDGSETYWDWENPTANYDNVPFTDEGEQLSGDLLDEESSSGYGTDEGETTEEDMPEDRKLYLHASRTERRPSVDSSTTEEEVTITRTPKLGTWYTDGNESFALADHKSQKLVIFVAKTPQRRHSFSGVEGMNLINPNFIPTAEPFSDMDQMIMGSPENIMLSANWMASANNGFMVNPEALTGANTFAFGDTMAQNTTGSQGSSTEDDNLDSGMLVEFDINDFVHTEAEDTDEDEISSAIGVESSPSTLRRPSAASAESHDETQIHPLLQHLGNVGVGAFRRNQNHHRLITRNNESHESLAFSSPIHEGTLRGVKHGKLAAVNTPMTPLRKTKAKAEFASIPLFPEPSPTPGQSKRKFIGEQQNGHKRNKSMV